VGEGTAADGVEPKNTKLIDVIAFVVILALALAFARSALRQYDLAMKGASGFWRAWWIFYFYFNALMAGIALFGGFRQAVEVATKGARPAWAWGRLVWALASLTLVLSLAGRLLQIAGYGLFGAHPPAYTVGGVTGELIRTLGESFSGQILLTLLPALAAFRVVGLPAHPVDDFHERAGRVYFSAVVFWIVFLNFVRSFV
jgi:hypothetical protein